MTKKHRIEDWYLLTWHDDAGKEDSMAGPHYALTDKEAELKKAGTNYTLEKMGWTETVPSKTKEVAGKELEVRG